LLQRDVRLWCNYAFSFEAIEQGQYAIESRDTSIAKVAVEGTTFTIRTVGPGTTGVVVTSRSGDTTLLTCGAYAFTGKWYGASTHPLPLFTGARDTVVVVAASLPVAREIREELEPRLEERDYFYLFSDETNELARVTRRYTATASYSLDEGTYSFDAGSQTLAFMHDDQTETHACKILPDIPYTPLVMALQEDLTGEYAARYPGAGITGVHVVRHVVSSESFWWTGRVDASTTITHAETTTTPTGTVTTL
jgi:hypothetical protein